ncbi:MAG: hypothetical protein OXI24_01440, partial [Candidatus Poribacteria bacterium]|nr:hypothetical protein [Candidatus Poribacteria bacterium]
AKHLNEKDNVTQIHIQSSFIAAEFLGYYFPGDIHFAKPLTDTPIQYEVVYIRDVQLGWPPKQGIYNGELEHVITLNDIELVWIYRVEKFEKKQAIAKNLRAEKINKHAAAYERLLLENPATAHAELVKYAQATFGEHRLIEEWIVLYGRLSHQKEAAFPEFIQLLTLAKNMLEDNFPEIAAEAITQLDSSLKSLRSMSKQSSKNFQKLPFRFTLMSLK